jgi:hypothetical protein
MSRQFFPSRRHDSGFVMRYGARASVPAAHNSDYDRDPVCR